MAVKTTATALCHAMSGCRYTACNAVCSMLLHAFTACGCSCVTHVVGCSSSGCSVLCAPHVEMLGSPSLHKSAPLNLPNTPEVNSSARLYGARQWPTASARR
eukprot:566442-Pelagomonas_calceolata.AAC.11